MAQKIIDTIDEHYKEDLFDESRLSSYIKEEGYQLLYLRQLAPKSDDIEFKVLCFLFRNGEFFRYEDAKKDFERLKNEDAVFDLIERLLLDNRSIVQTFSNEIEELEDSLYTRSFPKQFIDVWFDLRNELSKIDRYNSRLIEVFESFNRSKVEPKPLLHSDFQDLIATIQFNQSKIRDELSRLDILHHYYLSIKGDRLNGSIFLLTVISGLFLPLNLVVGFFGMNTENLFFKDNPMGTNWVVYILLGLLGVLLFFIPLFRLLDRLIFSHVLGKLDLYQKLNQKFDKISKTFKVE